MAGFNGSGTFVRTYNWVTDKGNNVKVTASRMDGEDDGFATGLSTCIAKDGQTTTTAAVPFAVGIKVSDGSAGTPAVNFINDTDTGIYRIGANQMAVICGGDVAMDFGTATVSASCMVLGGTLSVAGALTFTSGLGAAAATSIDVSGTASAAIMISTGEVRGASANFTSTCSAAFVHTGGLVAASASFSATCSAAFMAVTGGITGASANFTATCSAAAMHTTGALVVGSGLTVSAGAVSLPAGSIANAALAAPGAMVYLGTLTASNSATLDFTSISATYDDYIFEFENLLPATDNQVLQIRVGTGAGPSYQSANYVGCMHIAYNGGPSNTFPTDCVQFFSTASSLGVGNDSTYGASGRATLYNANSATLKTITGHAGALVASGTTTFANSTTAGTWTAGTDAITAVRFLFASGNITSGQIRCYGLTHA